MTDEEKLPCGIPRAEHPRCWERDCYLSGEGCPVHQGPKKGIIYHLPHYLQDTVNINGVKIYLGAQGYSLNSDMD